MADAESEWLRSFTVIKLLREEGVIDPVGTLIRLAATKQVRSRAVRCRFDEADSDEPFPQDRYIPEEFWRCVNAGTAGTQIDGDAGVFATTVIYNPEIGNYSDREHIWLSGVTFHAEDLAAFLGRNFESGGSASPNPTQGAQRTPSVKKGNPPTDDEIRAKADEMHARGIKSRDIAKIMCREPGFENAGTVVVRDLLKGRWPRGRKKKSRV